MPLKGEHPSRPTYEVVSVLPGGKSKVVVANHRIFGRQCVQKVVDISNLSGATAFQEPQLLDQMSHSRITPIDEVQWDPDLPTAITFVMPLYEGGSVEGALSETHRFSLQETVQIGVDIADALSYLHITHGFIHRDMKPGNVLLDSPRDRGYLSDLGSAARIDQPNGTAPATLTTLPYMPPEALATGRIGPEGDVYGLGFTMYEMLAGRLDWHRFSGLEMQKRLMRGKRSIPDSPLSRFPPHVPEGLRRLVRKAIRPDPVRRFTSAQEFLAALQQVQVVDWRLVSGSGPEGEWRGTWPPHAAVRHRLEYRVTSQILRAGSGRGGLRLMADYRRPGRLNWRSAGVPKATVDTGDESAITQFFAEVSARAAHRTPAR